jgi:hypothetical protein
MLDHKQDGRRLLATVAPIRKKAGKVREMDVLTGFAATLANDGKECLTQLMEHLGAKRLRSVRRLHDTVVQKRKKARRSLRRYSGLVGRRATKIKSPLSISTPRTIAKKNSKWFSIALACSKSHFEREMRGAR